MFWLLGCVPQEVNFGRLSVGLVDDSLQVQRDGEELVSFDGFSTGQGKAIIDFQSGSYLFTDEAVDWTETTHLRVRSASGLFALAVEDEDKNPLATIEITSPSEDELLFTYTALDPDVNRLRSRFDCVGEEAILGTGAQAWDVDHRGERFPLFVSEPGIGKSDTDDPPDNWFVEGTRHASSFPQPFLLMPDRSLGLEVATMARIELDLCNQDPDRAEMVVWDNQQKIVLMAEDSPLQVVEHHALLWGTPMAPPDWALGGAWVDAIRGTERVRAVASELREVGASVSAIWTEDWKGGDDYQFGYHLSDEWELDPTKYPDAPALAAELEEQGYAWLAYFSPFVSEDSKAGGEASDFVIQTETGDPYWFVGMTFQPTSVLDLTRDDARAWAVGKMKAALDIGFDGWMTDFAEWLPADAQLRGADALDAHNAYPLWWQDVSAEATADADAVYFSRSGWASTSTLSPVTWAGDQRTSFDADDGMPTVLPMGIGLGIGGVPFYTHDIAGYQSLGNPTSDKELWFRWCELGAFSPIMRTHHGAFDEDNWQFDTDESTLAHFARYSQEHARLFPYLKGLAAQAQKKGTPLILHPALLFPSVNWAAIDAWMLGPSLYVAPVMEAGALSRPVTLPSETTWYDYWTGAVASSGEIPADLETIPVFVPAGTVLPMFTTAPDTFRGGSGLRTAEDADLDRTIKVFGKGGSFLEADGTRYTVSGSASAAGTTEGDVTSGELTVNGLTLKIEGTISRHYRLIIVP